MNNIELTEEEYKEIEIRYTHIHGDSEAILTILRQARIRKRAEQLKSKVSNEDFLGWRNKK